MRAGHFVALAHLMASQWRSESALERIQSRRLRRLVRHAYTEVPYYRDLFDRAGIKVDDIRHARDLAGVPLTTKADLLEVPVDQRTARGVPLDRCRRSLTSGTTGVPLDIYFSREDWTRLNLGIARACAAGGAKPWHRVASFVGRKHPVRKPSWFEYLGLWRGEEISSWCSPDEWIAALRRIQPDVVIGYAVTLRLLAEAVREREIEDVRPRLVVSGSGVLDDFSRKVITAAFGCRVLDFYASYEGGAMAWECSTCGAYHVCADTVILEPVADGRPARPGSFGDVVVTNLQSYTMPIIRYRHDDVVIPSSRPRRCGRGLPMIDRVVGRTDDWITLPSGRRLPSHPFYYAVEPAPGIRRWRLVQESLTEIRVDIEPGPAFGSESEALIRRNLADVLEDGMEVRFELVDTLVIPPDRKFRQVRSRIGGEASRFSETRRRGEP